MSHVIWQANNSLVYCACCLWQGAMSAPQGQTLQLLRVLELVQELGGADSDADVGLSTLADIPAALWQVRPLGTAPTLIAPPSRRVSTGPPQTG